MTEALAAALGAELRRAVPPSINAFAARLAERAGGGAAAVLFYGSALRDGALDALEDSVLDFYVLVDRAAAWPGPGWAARANRLLPPNVGYHEAEFEGVRLRAKVAVMSLAQFRAAMAMRALDTTLWARFSQPCACVHARSEADALVLRDAVVQAVITASRWAALLGPARGEAADYWRALYRCTYAAELRVERGTRALGLIAHDAPRYALLLPLAWQAAGLAFRVEAGGTLCPAIDTAERARAERRWRLRRSLGRPLNLLRLFKAALTFDNAVDYVAWKVERHSGYRIEPTAFQRRHPLLAAPALYWRLRRRGVLR